MASFKRRRAINIDAAYIARLNARVWDSPAKTPTELASMIFVGTASPFVSAVTETGGKAQSISMTEAMWLSIRERATSIGRPTSATGKLLLTGEEPSLTKVEIDFGLARAKEREEKRASGAPEEEAPTPRPKAKKKPKKKAPSPKPESVAVSEVKQPDPEPENIVKQMREEETEEQKQRRMKLSKGHPIGEGGEGSRPATKPNPEDDSHGGVFLF